MTSNNNKNNYIAIAKAIGIILMVIGHSGGPEIVCRFLYTFHMPLFFLCSGYFFKEILDLSSLKVFCLKRTKGLYMTYLKWSILFLILHNIFYNLNIYNELTNSYLYQLKDYLTQLEKVIAMTDYELLIRPFWFIKELFISSIVVAILSLLKNRLLKWLRNEILATLMLLLTICFKLTNFHLPIIGNCSILTLSTAYLYTGILYRKYKHTISTNNITIIATFAITLVGSILFIGDMDMRYTTAINLIPYFLLSIIGIIMTFTLSERLEHTPLSSYFYYVGNHTMPILALNLLALKAGNLIKIGLYHLPIKQLSSYTVIYEYNTWFWTIYTVLGVTIPLLAYYLYNKIKITKKFHW